MAPVSLPLARADHKLTTSRIMLRQDRMFLVGDERAAPAIACADGDDPAPCAITSAAAIVPPDAPGASSHRAVPVTFSAAEGGGLATSFQPSGQGFGGYHGPIRIELALDVVGEIGGASFAYLSENQELQAGREGVVHTTKSYALRDFSDAEWESEEKSRHMKELTKDVAEASAHAGSR